MSLTQIYARLNDENACYWSILIRIVNICIQFRIKSLYYY